MEDCLDHIFQLHFHIIHIQKDIFGGIYNQRVTARAFKTN